MTGKLPEGKIALFSVLIHEFSTAVKNSILYSPGHPVFEFSVRNVKESFERWFTDEKKIEIGISPDNLLLNGEYVKKKDELFGEIADYLHRRGIIALSVTQGVDAHELADFFQLLKKDGDTIRREGGIAKNVSSLSHISVKEIDYSSLLTSAKGKVTQEMIF